MKITGLISSRGILHSSHPQKITYSTATEQSRSNAHSWFQVRIHESAITHKCDHDVWQKNITSQHYTVLYIIIAAAISDHVDWLHEDERAW